MIIKKFLPNNCYCKKRIENIDSIIIHYISAINIDKYDPFNINKIIKIFKNYKVSAHYLIGRSGIIYILVKECNIAYHAGESKLNGRKNCNNFSIGIELVGTNDIEFTDNQYNSLILLTKNIRFKYNIPIKNIVGHCDVSPGRKIDPGKYFKWGFYINALQKTIEECKLEDKYKVINVDKNLENNLKENKKISIIFKLINFILKLFRK